MQNREQNSKNQKKNKPCHEGASEKKGEKPTSEKN